TFYIYNVYSKLFLKKGNDWGTHATVGEEGLRFVFNLTETQGTYNLLCELNGDNEWLKLFITDGGNIYLDAKETATDIYFSFKDLGSNTYELFGADLNPTWNASGEMANYLIGHNKDYTNTRDNIQTGTGVVYDYVGEGTSYDEGHFTTKWAFVSMEDYSNYQNKVVTYKAAVNLKSLIDDAKAKGVDVTDAQQVYDNTESTKEALDNAFDALNAKILEYYEKVVTPDSPITLTDLVKNAECNSIEGWVNEINATTWNTQTWIDESWAGFDGTTLNIWSASLNGKAYQKLTDLPNGIYIISLAAFSEKMAGYVYANENKAAVAGGAAGNTYTITTNVTDGTLEFGFGQDESGTNWVALDNASVKYYGSGVEAYRYWLNNLLESAPTFDDVLVQKALINRYENVLASVNTVTTKEEILNIIPTYEGILNEINLNIAAYDELKQAKNAAEELLANQYMNTYYNSSVSDYIIETVDDIIDSHDSSTEEVKAIIADLQAKVQEAQEYIWNMEKLVNELATAKTIFDEYSETCNHSAVTAYNEFVTSYEDTDFAEKTNSDVLALLNQLYDIEFNLKVPAEPASDSNPVNYTDKLSYPSFDNGAEGWINDGFGTCGLNTWNSFADGEIIDQLYLNLWNTNAARVYQRIENLPNGAYQFEVSAFADKEGFQVFANENYVDVKVGKNEDGVPAYYGNRYKVNAVINDGILEVGGRIAYDTEVWAMLDNCTITYFGTDSEIVTGIDNVSTPAKGEEMQVFSTTGARLSQMHKGINIVKTSNGDVKKVLVK
ncbi:MAG: hypothetical protein IJR86_07555, partial [Bacteroidaceae bacterium]|nr:hypothetical protein [Bacteroidaceae bacterium]